MRRGDPRRMTWRNPARGVGAVVLLALGVIAVGTVIAAALTAVMT